ncbi:putative RNA polymerase II subunit B1 CTD phosphatase rpap2 [Thalassophryne amazonica]|uniref:putative RNA polymerase II subunit B1 CTD phosphatase rpap2 n=1 Tax=Thalassophryne amazonica TaxID=390379 RepID=UPI001472318C|nr:putative RNA polymerase II subunit B1 CTD phosphatase rpap2 [Thalassophryne amazonica]
MEVRRNRRGAGSSKTSKKDNNGVKAQSAEEQARRREALREKLELEKRALQVVERLLEDSVLEDYLTDCTQLITPAHYRDVIEERSIVKLCGYPVCPNHLGKILSQQYKISTKTNKVYDITERKCFCSNFCYKASKQFELQISKTPLWLRQHERPAQVTLMKKGDRGSAGEEVNLSERPLQEKDVENPLTDPEESHGSLKHTDHFSQDDSSDAEQEQEFVSSVVPQKRGPRVHWGNLPKRMHEGQKEAQGQTEKQSELTQGQDEDMILLSQSQNEEAEGNGRSEKPECKAELCSDAGTSKEAVLEDRGSLDEASVEQSVAKMSLCSSAETVPQTSPLVIDSKPKQAEHTTSPPPFSSSNPTKGNRPPSDFPTLSLPSTPLDSCNMNSSSEPGLNITEVGMSKKGAAGLCDLLKHHVAGAKLSSVREKLLEDLTRTLKEWRTDETLMFLYGSNHAPNSSFTDAKDEDELDEDDLEDELSDGADAVAGSPSMQRRSSPAAGDYKVLHKEIEIQKMKVWQFYKGIWILREEAGEVVAQSEMAAKDQATEDPVLPLIDSQAQHLIQKRITVEKLTRCLRNIVGPLRLTMNDISTNLNNLIRTFRFTNANIIHKAPEWTLIAVVVLHLLSEVSPVVKDALHTLTSVEYLSTLMCELGLQEQDLMDVIQLFKIPSH